jgi:hypothetical protein
MQVEIASGHWIKLTDNAGKVVARADAYTGTPDAPNDPHWIVRDGGWSAPSRRVATEEVAASVLAMIAVTHTISAS